MHLLVRQTLSFFRNLLEVSLQHECVVQLRRLDDPAAEDVDHGEGDDDAHQGDQPRHPAPAPRPGPALHLLHDPERPVLGPGPRLVAGEFHPVEVLVGGHPHFVHVIDVYLGQRLRQLVLNFVTVAVTPVLQD